MLIPNVKIVFTLDGERKELEYRAVPLSAWAELKTRAGFTPVTLGEAIGELDVDAFVALAWLERRQTQRKLSWPRFVASLRDQVPDIDMDAEFDVIVDGVSALDEG